MQFTDAQKPVIKAAMVADPVANAFLSVGNLDGLAGWCNTTASPDYWVWKSKLTRSQATDESSVDATTFSWTAYIARSQGERDGWREIWALGTVNPSLPQVRAAFADIFSGGTGAAQRTHLLAVARRKAGNAEKVLATGTGSTASPGVMGYEGPTTSNDLIGVEAW